MKEEFDCILSFTTWKKRINDRKLLYVIQKALSQKTKYKYKVILCLSEEEFRGKENDIPSELLELEKLCGGKFEILWTWRNTRALKKLNPAMRKYSELPIITFDDDILLSDNAVEIFMNEHNKTPRHILGCDCHPLKRGQVYNKIQLVTHVRLYPPGSIADVDDEIFMDCFNGLEDDIWNGVRSSMKGSPSRKIGINGITLDGKWFPVLYPRETALNMEYRHADANAMVRKLCNKYPEYKKYCY